MGTGEDKEKPKGVLQETGLEGDCGGGGANRRGVKKYLRRVMDKRRSRNCCIMFAIYTRWPPRLKENQWS